VHAQRLVSVVKMATVLEECNTEEQHSVDFCEQMNLMQRILIKKLFMFSVGSVAA
jgi:hypothetical protein